MADHRVDFDCESSEITRCGNEHRKFIPTSVYPAKDGFIYMAIGSDLQWRRLTEIAIFAPIASAARATNEGRMRERGEIVRAIGAITIQHPVSELLAAIRAATIPVTQIRDIREVRELPQLRGRLTATELPGGRRIHMQPLAVDGTGLRTDLAFPPKYSADTRRILGEAGCSDAEVAELANSGVIP